MAKDNQCTVQGDLTGDMYYETTRIPDGRMVPFFRVYMMINGSDVAKPVHGLRIMFYGRLAREVEAYVRKGSRIIVNGHIRRRNVQDKSGQNQAVFEIVGEDVQYIKNINWILGRQRIHELDTMDASPDEVCLRDDAAIMAFNMHSTTVP